MAESPKGQYVPRHGGARTNGSTNTNNTDAKKSYEFLYGSSSTGDFEPVMDSAAASRRAGETQIIPDEVMSEYDSMTASSHVMESYDAQRYVSAPRGAHGKSTRGTYQRTGEAFLRDNVQAGGARSAGRSRAQGRAGASPASASASHRSGGAIGAPGAGGADGSGNGGFGNNAGIVMPPQKKKGRRRGLKIAIAIIVVLVALVAIFGVNFMNSAKAVRAEASTITKAASQIMEDFKDGNMDAVTNDIGSLAASAAFMKNETDGWMWGVAELIPVYGNDVKNVRTLSSVFDDLSRNMLVPFSAELPNLSLGNIIREDKSIDVEAITGLMQSMSNYREVIARADKELEGLVPGQVEQSNKALEMAQDYLGKADSLLEQADQIIPLLPQMLGANGVPRNYILIAQNNAELRATGGFAGSWGLLNVTDGRISLGDFSSFANMRGTAETFVDILDGEMLFYSPDFHEPGQFDFTPNYARFAQLSSAYWLNGTGQATDGVISIDPIFLEDVLGVVGGVTAPDGKFLDSTNTVQTLLHDVYFEYSYDPEYQDLYFAAVAGAAFDQVIHGVGKQTMMGLFDIVSKGGQNGNFLVWMANPDEQALMERFGLTGQPKYDPAKPVLGVFINEAASSKIDYYLDVNTTVGEARTNEDGTTSYPVTSTFANLVDTDRGDPAWSLPEYVSSPTDSGRMCPEVILFAPAGGVITDVVLSTEDVLNGEDVVKEAWPYGINGHRHRFYVYPASTVTMTYTVTASAEAVEPLTVFTAPTIQAALQGRI